MNNSAAIFYRSGRVSPLGRVGPSSRITQWYHTDELEAFIYFELFQHEQLGST